MAGGLSGAGTGKDAAAARGGGPQAALADLPAQAAKSFTAVVALAAPTGDMAAEPQTSAEPSEAEGPVRGAPRRPADGEDYASRLLHVYRGADGVQAWIRDASLDAASLPGLAEAMVDQLGDAGARLAALTVNGRRLALPTSAPRGEAPDAQDGQQLDEAEPARATINPNGAA